MHPVVEPCVPTRICLAPCIVWRLKPRRVAVSSSVSPALARARALSLSLHLLLVHLTALGLQRNTTYLAMAAMPVRALLRCLVDRRLAETDLYSPGMGRTVPELAVGHMAGGESTMAAPCVGTVLAGAPEDAHRMVCPCSLAAVGKCELCTRVTDWSILRLLQGHFDCGGAEGQNVNANEACGNRGGRWSGSRNGAGVNNGRRRGRGRESEQQQQQQQAHSTP